jgi:hypothetical protein
MSIAEQKRTNKPSSDNPHLAALKQADATGTPIYLTAKDRNGNRTILPAQVIERFATEKRVGVVVWMVGGRRVRVNEITSVRVAGEGVGR